MLEMYYSNEEQFKQLNGYVIDDIWYPRVTQIVSIKAKPALYKFYGDAGFKAGKDISARSAEEGTKVHETVEKVLTEGINSIDHIEPSIQPAIDSFLNFLKTKTIEVNPAHVERKVVHHEKRYAGTMDALAIIDGKFGILDIKTSQSIYRDYNLQTSAYMDALIHDPLFQEVQTRWILRIDQAKTCKLCGSTLREKGGNSKIKNSPRGLKCQHEWLDPKGIIELKEFPYWQEDFEAFLAAKRLWEWENEYWLKKIDYL